ncbi:Gtr1/RagA G protein conserved region-domain-containing protein [Circinella umbellata]|nr:Gtr1/RagA G protein conserved region-domain-containing protein [Circinella umbellata]
MTHLNLIIHLKDAVEKSSLNITCSAKAELFFFDLCSRFKYDYPHINDSEITDTLEDTTGSDKPRILLMGLQRSGKSSIQRVVFGKMPPNDTLYLESTTKIQKEDITRSFIDFQIWDFPGQVNFFEMTYDSQEIFGAVGALIFVIDAQDDYSDALHRLFFTVTSAYRVNQNISFEVLIHKVDGLSDDYKIDTQRDVQQRMGDMLADAQMEHIHLSYYLTSIYDHSIYEAFSKIIQKLIRELPTLENLLNVLCQNSGIDKAYLFDTLTKIYIATDSSPVDMQSYELCSDMIDVIIDIECIYGAQVSSPNGRLSLSDEEDEYGNGNGGDHLHGVNGNGTSLRDHYDTDRDEDDDGDNQSQEQSLRRTDGVGQNEAEASSLIKLDNGDVLYMRECFKEAVTDVFDFSQKRNNQQQQQQQMVNLAQQQSSSE